MNGRVLVLLLGITTIAGTRHLTGRENHSLVSSANQAAAAKVFNIKSHGAIGDGIAMETEAVQKTIDACHAAGGGIVRVPAGDFQIGTIRLKSNITLSLDHGASLLGSRNIDDYPEHYFFGTLPAWGAYIRHARNIQFRNGTLTTRLPDQRKKIVLEDVEGFSEIGGSTGR